VSRAFFAVTQSPAAWPCVEYPAQPAHLDSFLNAFPHAARQARSIAVTVTDAGRWSAFLVRATAPPPLATTAATAVAVAVAHDNEGGGYYDDSERDGEFDGFGGGGGGGSEPGPEVRRSPNSHVRTLSVTSDFLPPTQFARVAAVFPRLETLRIAVRFGTEAERRGVKRIAFARLPCLRDFRDESTANGWGPPETEPVAVLPPRLVRYRDLRRHQGTVTLVDIDADADTSPLSRPHALRILELTGGSRLPADPVPSLACAPNLTDLDYPMSDGCHTEADLRALVQHPSLTRLRVCRMPVGLLRSPRAEHDSAPWATRPRLEFLRVTHLPTYPETDAFGRPTPQLAYLAAFPNLRELCFDSPAIMTVDADRALKLVADSVPARSGSLAMLWLPDGGGAWFRPPRPDAAAKPDAVARPDADAAKPEGPISATAAAATAILEPTNATVWAGRLGGFVAAVTAHNLRPLVETVGDARPALPSPPLSSSSSLASSMAPPSRPTNRQPHANAVAFLGSEPLRVLVDATVDVQSSVPAKLWRTPDALWRLLSGGCVVAFGRPYRELPGFERGGTGDGNDTIRNTNASSVVATAAAAACTDVGCLCRMPTSPWRFAWDDHLCPPPQPIHSRLLANAVRLADS
jgi:hypothetical protein